MARLIFAGTLWLAALVGLAVVPISLRDDLRFDAAAEVEATVTAHHLGPAVATRPGQTFTSLALTFPLADGTLHTALLHGELDPPPVGSPVLIRHLVEDPAAVRRAVGGVARFADTLGGALASLLCGLLAWAATRGCRLDAPPHLRYGPGLLVGLGLGALGLVFLSALAYDAATVGTRYRPTTATVEGHTRCGDVSLGRGTRTALWCAKLRYTQDGREHTTLDGPRLAILEDGTQLTVRVHPDRPDFAVSQALGDLSIQVVVGLTFLLGGLITALTLGRRWRRAAVLNAGAADAASAAAPRAG